MKPKKINSLVSEYFKETKYIEIKETLNINKVWQNLVGETIAKNTEILNIKHGKIIVKTINPVWRNELIFQKEDLLQRLKKQEPKLKIKEIEFK